jgi:hypothetical protein
MNNKIKKSIKLAQSIEEVAAIVAKYNAAAKRNQISVCKADMPNSVDIRLTVNLKSGSYEPKFSGVTKRFDLC